MSKRPLLRSQKNLNFRSQSGQVAVIVFLIMAVLLVVGLSLAARTSQEIELAGQQEDTTRVFNAAETGIEQALSDPDNFELTAQESQDIQNLADTDTEGTVTITPEEGFRNEFESGETATVYTTGASATFSIMWNRPTSEAACNTVLAVTLYVGPAPNFTAQHFGIRPNGCTDSPNTTNFTVSNDTSPGPGADGVTQYRYQHNFTLPTNTTMVRIKPLRAATNIEVDSSALSPQLYNVRSEARDTAAGNTEVRAIEVTRSRPAPPSVFDYALYSGGDLTK